MRKSILNVETCSMVLAHEGKMFFRIIGTSMEPSIKQGDIVCVVPSGSLVAGNCYLFQSNGSLLVHRLVTQKKDTFMFMGDNSGSIESIRLCKVIGMVDLRCSDQFKMFLQVTSYLLLFLFGKKGTIPYTLYKIRVKCNSILFAMFKSVGRQI